MRVFPKRTEAEPDKGKWRLWRWLDIRINGKLYLTRLTMLRTPWFALHLHWIHLPDPDRDLHDHPWPFVAFILRGGYTEFRVRNPENQISEPSRIRWFNHHSTTSAHRIVDVRPKTLTLVITGRKSKSWGFWVPEPFRDFEGNSDFEDYMNEIHTFRTYVPWREYIKVNHG